MVSANTDAIYREYSRLEWRKQWISAAEFITNSFEMLRPAQKAAEQLRPWDQLWNEDFVKSYRVFQR